MTKKLSPAFSIFTFVLAFLSLPTAPVLAWECAPAPSLEFFNEAVDEQEVQRIVSLVEAAEESIAERTDFDIEKFGHYIDIAERIGRNTGVSPELRSRAFRAAAGIYGRIIDKQQSLRSIPCGRNAIKILKKSLEIYPSHQSSIVAFARSIEGICASTGKYPKFFIEVNLKMDIQRDAQRALMHLQDLRGPLGKASEEKTKSVYDNLNKCAAGKLAFVSQNRSQDNH